MEVQRKPGEGICILSLDGGGSGSISQLCMIDEIMERVASDLGIEEDTIRPADRFDLIGGVGVGGFVALLLGRLGMTAKQAKDELSRVGNTVFTKGYEMESPETNKKRLQEAIETMLRECGHEIDINLRDDSARCKVVIFAASPNVVNLCQPLRTYRHRGSRLECTFVQAACALMAVPGSFSPSCIGPTSREQHFIGIPRGRYNPTRVVFREARSAFSDKTPVSLALSLGSGQEATFTEVTCHATRWSHIHCDVASNDLSHQLSGVAAYLRLNVDSGIEDIHVDNWQQLGLIETRTTGYLEMDGVTRYIDEACQWIINRNGSATLGQLNGTSSEVTVRSHSQRLEDLLERRFEEMGNIMQGLGIEKITLVDAIGNDIDIPRHFCPTYPMLLEVIGIYFKYQRPPGTDLVERGDYRLVHGSRRSILDPVEWNQIEKARLKVEMSMVLRRRNVDKARCPQCRTLSLSTNGWVTCSTCSAQFQSEDHVEPGGHSRHKDEHATQSSIVIPGVGPGDSLVTETKKNAKKGQAQFRLISVINLLDNAANEARAFPAPLNVTDALSYLDSVKSQFHDHLEVYNRFLYIMKDFKNSVIDTTTVIEQVARLFLGHPDLINGFNVFLPYGYRIEIGSQGSVVAHTPGGITRIHSPPTPMIPQEYTTTLFNPISFHDPYFDRVPGADEFQLSTKDMFTGVDNNSNNNSFPSTYPAFRRMSADTQASSNDSFSAAAYPSPDHKLPEKTQLTLQPDHPQTE